MKMPSLLLLINLHRTIRGFSESLRNISSCYIILNYSYSNIVLFVSFLKHQFQARIGFLGLQEAMNMSFLMEPKQLDSK